MWRSIALTEPPALQKPSRRAASPRAGRNRWAAAAAAAVSQAGERGGRARGAGPRAEVCHHPALPHSPHGALIRQQLRPFFSLVF